MNQAEMNKRVLAVVAEIRHAEDEFARAIRTAADLERRYKRTEAQALLRVEGKNIQEREARAEMLDGGNLGDMRFEAHLAAGVRDAAKEALRNRAAELSALQSESALAREEARFLTTAPKEAVGP